MRMAYFDCWSGISGDMTLAALIDAGADEQKIAAGIASLGGAEISLRTTAVKKCGFRALQLVLQCPEEHAHRHLHHIEAMIDQATAVSDRAKKLAVDIFRQLAVAEAKVHNSTLEKVHFHEVGAMDSIADIVGTSIAIDDLGIEAVESSPVPTGSGFIEIAHGRVPVPAPATAELLQGIPIAQSPVVAELTTPTGAAIIRTLARAFGSFPAMTPHVVGYGAGQKDFAEQANVLRVVVGEAAESAVASGWEFDRVVVLQTNVDNTTAEDLSTTCELLLRAGALDVWQTPCTMKKGRLGVQISVLCAEAQLHQLETVLFNQTGTIGLRLQRLERHKLPRREANRDTKLGPVRGKEVLLPDGQWRFSVEHDELRDLAKANNLPLQSVRRMLES